MEMCAPTGVKRLEAFIECRTLLGSGKENINSFAVVRSRSLQGGEFDEVARTETVFNSASPEYCTSFELEYSNTSIEHSIVRVDVYNRQTEASEHLDDHELLGKATIPLESVLMDEGNRFAAQIAHPLEKRTVGMLMLYAEEIDMSNEENQSDIQIDVSAAVLRKRDWNKSTLGQRYELKRAHKHDDCNGNPVWLPIHKSDRIWKQHDSKAIVEFCSTSLKYRHVCNGDDERRMRIIIYATQSSNSKRASSEFLIGMVEFTLRDLCEIDPTCEVLPLEKGDVDVEDLGSLAILKAEPTDFGSLFSVQLNYETTTKYSSAVCTGAKKVLRKKPMLAVRRLPLSFQGREKSPKFGLNMDELSSPASALFTGSFCNEPKQRLDFGSP